MHQKRPFLTRKGDDGFNPTQAHASKGDTGFKQPGRLVDRAWPRGTSGLRGAVPKGLVGLAAAPVGGGRAWPGFEPTRSAMHSDTAPPVWRVPEGLVGLAAVPVRGRARERTHPKPRPIGGRRGACGAWPGFETTRRAKLAARTASGRAGHAAAGDQARPGTPAAQQAPPGPRQTALTLRRRAPGVPCS